MSAPSTVSFQAPAKIKRCKTASICSVMSVCSNVGGQKPDKRFLCYFKLKSFTKICQHIRTVVKIRQ